MANSQADGSPTPIRAPGAANVQAPHLQPPVVLQKLKTLQAGVSLRSSARHRRAHSSAVCTPGSTPATSPSMIACRPTKQPRQEVSLPRLRLAAAASAAAASSSASLGRMTWRMWEGRQRRQALGGAAPWQ